MMGVAELGSSYWQLSALFLVQTISVGLPKADHSCSSFAYKILFPGNFHSPNLTSRLVDVVLTLLHTFLLLCDYGD